jgi:hypothetical protein
MQTLKNPPLQCHAKIAPLATSCKLLKITSMDVMQNGISEDYFYGCYANLY